MASTRKQHTKEQAKHPPYQDYANLSFEKVSQLLNPLSSTSTHGEGNSTKQPQRTRRSSKMSFPMKLHALLESLPETDRAFRWQHHGRAFKVHDKERFVTYILPTCFSCHNQFATFQRQLNLYPFRRITGGPDEGAYYHPLFLRSRSELCTFMHRKKSQQNTLRRTLDPTTEPDLCALPPLPQRSPRSLPEWCTGGTPITLVGSHIFSINCAVSAKRKCEAQGHSGSSNSNSSHANQELVSDRPTKTDCMPFSAQMNSEASQSHALLKDSATSSFPKRIKLDPDAHNSAPQDDEQGALRSPDIDTAAATIAVAAASAVAGSNSSDSLSSETFTEQPDARISVDLHGISTNPNHSNGIDFPLAEDASLAQFLQDVNVDSSSSEERGEHDSLTP